MALSQSDHDYPSPPLQAEQSRAEASVEVEHLRGQFSDMMEERDFLRGSGGGESEGEGGNEARVAHLKGKF